MLPGETPQPARRQAPAVLPGLRLSATRTDRPPSLPIALAVSVLSGLLVSLALPPADIGPLAFVAAAPFLWVIRDARPRRAFLLGWAFGIAYVGTVVWWASLFGWIAWVPLALFQGIYFALLGLLVPALWRRRHPVRSALAFAAAWVVLEWLRSTWPFGVPWGLLGYTQHDNGLLLRLASVTGVWGLSFVVAFANAAVVAAMETVGEGRRRVAAVAVGLAALLALGPALIPAASARGPSVDVAIVQGNVPRGIVGDRLLEDRQVAENHARLHRTLAGDPPDVAIWPENSVDHDPATDPDLAGLVQGAIRDVGAWTVVGTITDAPGGDFYNENQLYAPDGSVVARYRKQRPVPFGEYIPFRRWLGWIKSLRQIPRDMARGDAPVALQLDSGPREPAQSGAFTSVICFENAFPKLVRDAVRATGAGFLIVSTNNASFERTALSEQHVMMSQVRAVENGRWVVHAAVSGISAFVDPSGRVVERSALFEVALLRRPIPTATGTTIYGRLGDWVPLAALVGVLAAFVAAGARRSSRRTEPMSPPDRALVVLPTYNERDTIEAVVSRLLAADARVEVLVVDDGSPDGTGEVVRALAAGEGRVRLLERETKGGLASAYVAGFALGLDERYPVIVEMDADLSHQPEQIGRLLDATASHDLVIGSRYVPGGSVTNWSRVRRILSRGGNLYARLALGLPLTDMTSGFRAYRRDLLATLMGGGVHSDGYAFQIELAYRAWRAGYSVGEVPITFAEREHGKSKISRRIVLEAVWRVALWGIRDRFRPAPATADAGRPLSAPTRAG